MERIVHKLQHLSTQIKEREALALHSPAEFIELSYGVEISVDQQNALRIATRTDRFNIGNIRDYKTARDNAIKCISNSVDRDIVITISCRGFQVSYGEHTKGNAPTMSAKEKEIWVQQEVLDTHIFEDLDVSSREHVGSYPTTHIATLRNGPRISLKKDRTMLVDCSTATNTSTDVFIIADVSGIIRSETGILVFSENHWRNIISKFCPEGFVMQYVPSEAALAGKSPQEIEVSQQSLL